MSRLLIPYHVIVISNGISGFEICTDLRGLGSGYGCYGRCAVSGILEPDVSLPRVVDTETDTEVFRARRSPSI